METSKKMLDAAKAHFTVFDVRLQCAVDAMERPRTQYWRRMAARGLAHVKMDRNLRRHGKALTEFNTFKTFMTKQGYAV